ncbi:unnamed protein product, partial [Urochloa humidicola]
IIHSEIRQLKKATPTQQAAARRPPPISALQASAVGALCQSVLRPPLIVRHPRLPPPDGRRPDPRDGASPQQVASCPRFPAATAAPRAAAAAHLCCAWHSHTRRPSTTPSPAFAPAPPVVLESRRSLLLHHSAHLRQAGVRARKEDLAYQHQFILHAALDVVQDLAWTTNAMFLRSVDRFNDLVVSVYVTAGHTRFMLLHDSRSDDGIKSFFQEVHELYIK